jgi:O-antigen/teichoic acid export membrane protein
MNSLLKDSAINFIARIVFAFLQLFLQFGIALFLSVHEQGTYYAFIQLTVFVSLLASPGLGSAAIFFLQKKGQNNASIIAGTLVAILTWSPLVCLAILYLATLSGVNALFAIKTDLLAMALVAATFTALYQEGRRMLLGINLNLFFNISHIVTLCLNVILFLVLSHDTTSKVTAAVNACVISLVIGTVLVYGRLFIAHPPTLRLINSALLARIRYGLLVWISMIIAYVNYRLIFFIVRKVQGEEQSGLFSMAIMLSEVIWFIADAVTIMLFPNFSGRSVEESTAICPRVSRNTFFLSTVSAIAVAGAGAWFLLTIGHRYQAAFGPFLLLLPGTLIFSVSKVISVVFLTRQKFLFAILTALGMLLATVAGSALLVPRLGINGAALVTSLVYILGSFAALWYYRRLSGTSFRQMLFLERDDWAIYAGFLKKRF